MKSTILVSSMTAVAMTAQVAYALPQLDWQKQKDAFGIQAYTAKMGGTSQLAFRGVTDIKTSLDTIVSTLRDVPSMSAWMHTCYDAKLIEEKNINERIATIKIRTPTFLVADRDLVVSQTIVYTSPAEVIVNLTGIPDYLPAQKDYVRVPTFDAQWILTQITPESIRVEYRGMIDPGGSIPTSITNAMLIDTPFFTLRNLKERLTTTNK